MLLATRAMTHRIHRRRRVRDERPPRRDGSRQLDRFPVGWQIGFPFFHGPRLAGRARSEGPRCQNFLTRNENSTPSFLMQVWAVAHGSKLVVTLAAGNAQAAALCRPGSGGERSRCSNCTTKLSRRVTSQLAGSNTRKLPRSNLRSGRIENCASQYELDSAGVSGGCCQRRYGRTLSSPITSSPSIFCKSRPTKRTDPSSVQAPCWAPP